MSNPVLKARQLANGSVTTAQILDGTIQGSDVAAAAIANANLASDTARSNLLTNGGFEIWQRGNGPFAGNLTYSADRWMNLPAGSDTISVSRDTTNVDTNSNAAAAVTFTLGTGGGGTAYVQKIEDLPQLKTRTVTISMRVRTNVANAVRVIVSGDGLASRTNSAFHMGDGTYQTLSATIILAGATAIYVGVGLVASCTAYLDNAMLVVGSQAADYAPLHPADDLARCLRYYEVTVGGAASNEPVSTAQNWAPTGGGAIAPYLPKAATPTVTFSAASDFVVMSTAGSLVPVTSMPINNIGPRSALINYQTAGGLVAGQAGLFLTGNTNARIPVEVNP